MTWTLRHDNETVGEWSDDIVDKVVKQLKSIHEKKQIAETVAEFLPNPIREILTSS
jgi:hypothetical protein